MEIIADANVFLSVILNEPDREKIISYTKDCELVSPEILPYEIGNALSAMMKRNRLNKEQVLQSYTIFESIPLRLVKVNIDKALSISCKYNLYAYDAYYLEAAYRLKMPLLTFDKKMKSSGIDLNIETMGI